MGTLACDARNFSAAVLISHLGIEGEPDAFTLYGVELLRCGKDSFDARHLSTCIENEFRDAGQRGGIADDESGPPAHPLVDPSSIHVWSRSEGVEGATIGDGALDLFSEPGAETQLVRAAP